MTTEQTNSARGISAAPMKRLVAGEKSLQYGLVVGTCTTLLLQPFDLVKTRMQSPTTRPLGLGDTAKVVAKNEGFWALWKGSGASLVRSVPGYCLYFYFAQRLASLFVDRRLPTAARNLAVGFFARLLAGVAVLPLTVLKTRMEAPNRSHNSSLSLLYHIVKTKRQRQLFAGLYPTVLRDCPYAGLYLCTYRFLLGLMESRLKVNSDSCFTMAGCGLAAGSISCLITQPFDVIKTRMQLKPLEYGAILHTASGLVSREGWSSLFTGLVPRTCRKTLSSALAWTLYDTLSLHSE